MAKAKAAQLDLFQALSAPAPTVARAHFVPAQGGQPEHYVAWQEREDVGEFGRTVLPAAVAHAVARAVSMSACAPGTLGDSLRGALRPLVPYIHRQLYDRDGGHSHPRRRFELELPREAGAGLVDLATSARCLCASCSAPISPFRRRRTAEPARRAASERFYVSVSCTLDANVACARRDAAAEAYLDLERALEEAG